jgi:membrane protein implicated in regulation of membrane protease activity
MDIPTRVGLGGTALFTAAGSVQPLFGWWVSGPLMAICAGVAAWGFWPLMQNLVNWPAVHALPARLAAARRELEKIEKACVVFHRM